MRLVAPFVALTVLLASGACSNVDTCEEPQFYELAEPGKRIEPPEDLDALSGSREMSIPEPSPRPPHDRSKGCLDMPPTLRIDSDEDEDEADEEGAGETDAGAAEQS